MKNFVRISTVEGIGRVPFLLGPLLLYFFVFLPASAHAFGPVSAGIDQTSQSSGAILSTQGVSVADMGNVVSIAWSIVSTPPSADSPQITHPDPALPDATFTTFSLVGAYVFQMTVTYDDASVLTDDMTITRVPPGNPPTVDAGDKQILPIGQEDPVLVEDALVYDDDGPIVDADWTYISGPQDPPTISVMTLVPFDGQFMGFVNAGPYTFRLTAEDADGQTAYDEMVVVVCETDLGSDYTWPEPGGWSAPDGWDEGCPGDYYDLASDMTPTVNGDLAVGETVTFNGRVKNVGGIAISDMFWDAFRYSTDGGDSWSTLGDPVSKNAALPLGPGETSNDLSDGLLLTEAGELQVMHCVDWFEQIQEVDELEIPEDPTEPIALLQRGHNVAGVILAQEGGGTIFGPLNNCETESFTVATSLGSCSASTIDFCDLSDTSNGGTSGACTTGYTGSCTYSCSGGSWTPAGANTCTSDAPAPTGSIDADSTSIIQGQSVSITWDSSGATSCIIDPTGWTGTEETTGQADSPTETTMYSLLCDGLLMDAVVVNVNQTGALPVLMIPFQYAIVRQGSEIVVNWDTNNFADGGESLCTLSDGGGEVDDGLTNGTGDAETGSATVVIDARTTFTLTCPLGTSEYTVNLVPQGWEG